MTLKITCLSIIAGLLCGFYTRAQEEKDPKFTRRAENRLEKLDDVFSEWGHLGKMKIDSLNVSRESKTIQLYFSKPLSYMPFRENEIDILKNQIYSALGRKFQNYSIKVFTDDKEISFLVPNALRSDLGIDTARLDQGGIKKDPFICKQDAYKSTDGLYNNYIALWHSHGWYYESKLDRWEWQRARLYGAVEDVSPMEYVLPYLVPMLENAGANVFLPRERDVQINEVIVDNDELGKALGFELSDGVQIKKKFNGFAVKDTLYVGENPFKMGTSYLVNKENGGKVAEYIPEIPEKGEYAVYVSYGRDDASTAKVKYVVHHTGGATSFLVNQKMGGGTWIYLGKFIFDAGKNPLKGAVDVVSVDGDVSLDAVKFGGGMGNVARRPSRELAPNKWSLNANSSKDDDVISVDPEQFKWKLSGKPRYLEAARYYLQYAGMPDTLVFSLNDEKNDYNDDYQSRGEWVNYLMGAPNGPTKNREVEGLNIPIDLAFAFHTDAGVTPNDSIIGTLGIYSSVRDNGVFPNGQSKLASRDLTDLIQSQVVNDVRKLYREDWTRRGMWDKQYSEAWRPNVPTMLLELLSHQNMSDIKFGLDPRFRFAVSRAIYKGILKFQAFQEGREYVVQPLPVDHFSITSKGENTFLLTWQPVMDPLEASAVPTKYKVYRRLGDNGFDNGTIVSGTSFEVSIDQLDEIYGFKVTALNDGGESFASEVLSLGVKSNAKGDVLVVNGFDRISGPAFVDKDGFAGVAWWDDQGVADKCKIGFTGYQYDFDKNSAWLDDDNPGWGASYGDMEGKIIPGNSFDFPFIHGQAIMAAGYSFVSVSDEAFCEKGYGAENYAMVDIILGEEKTTPQFIDKAKTDYQIYTPAFMDKLTVLSRMGVNMFISGAYVGSDYVLNNDTIAAKFANEILHFKWRTNHVVKSGSVYSSDYGNEYFNEEFSFNTTYDPVIYQVEAPDAIEPFGKQAITAFRYGENNSSAGVAYNGDYRTVILGFPFEAIKKESQRVTLMAQILSFFE
ncbi:hypothetical protein DMA11_07700 [Marinilabiliaceae bacterium JC017]|nr:hypothetical protein DMA11_07700 [Marinilabiliaceae bacterium JC017]